MTKGYERKDLSFSIFKNDYKKTLKQPDLTGQLRFEDKDHSIALWVKGDELRGKINIDYVDKVHTGDSINFVLKKNKNKKEDNHPDRIGEVTLKGVNYDVGAYNNTSKNGLKFIAGSLREPRDTTDLEKPVTNEDNNGSIFDF